MKTTISLLLTLTIGLASSHALAEFNLEITEVDPYGTDFNDPEEDDDIEWFEVTNTGDMPWEEGTDGALYYDDRDPDFENADLISGITMIAPGESVVLLNHDGAWPDPSEDGAIAFFQAEFPDYGGQIGTYDGSGLSSSGDDGATLWIGEPTSNDGIVSFLEYPSGSQVDGQTYQLPGGVWADPNPGSVVPEPQSLLLLMLGAGLLAARHRRN